MTTCEFKIRIVVFEPTSFSYPLVGALLNRKTKSCWSKIRKLNFYILFIVRVIYFKLINKLHFTMHIM